MAVHPFAGPFPLGPRLSLVRPEALGGACSAVERLDAGETCGAAPDEKGRAVLVLSGRFGGPVELGEGDVLLAPPGTPPLVNRGESPGSLLVDVSPVEPDSPASPSFLGRDALTGERVPGVTGARFLSRSRSRTVLRLGPPPGARWVVLGLRSFAVFAGKVEVVEGDAGVAVRAGELAVVSDPTATLYLQAGGDAAWGVGFGSPRLGVWLG